MGTSDTVSRSEQKLEQYKFYPWVAWGLAAAYFFSDYFARVSIGVMTHELMQAFNVTALGLGVLFSYFYYPYVLMQIPVGLLVDRFSVRKILTFMSLLTAIGCYCFATASSLGFAEFGRFLIGFSASFAFVGALKLASVWFPSQRFGLLAGLTQALGMLGAAVGETPVALSVETFGWRNTMMIMVVVFVVIAFLIAALVRDRPPHLPRVKPQHEKVHVWHSLLTVLSNPQSWWNAAYIGMVFAPTAVFAEAWGVTYLRHSHAMTLDAATSAVALIFIGWGIGGPVTGWISDRIKRRKPLMMFSAVMGAVILSILLYVPDLPVTCIYPLLLLFGMTNTGVSISYAVASEINSHHVGGTSMAFANMASVIIGAFLQPIVGLLLDLNAGHDIINNVAIYSAHDFRQALFILPLCSILGVVFACFIRETHCRGVG